MRKIRRGGMALGVVALSLVVFAGCSKGSDTPAAALIPKTFNVVGDLRLNGTENVSGDLSTCRGTGKFVDIGPGAPVIVANQKGKPIATGTINFGLGTNYYQGALNECTFRLRVPVLPRAKGYYFVFGRQLPQAVPVTQLIAGNGQIWVDANPPLPIAPPPGS